MDKQTIKRILVRYMSTHFEKLADSMQDEKYFITKINLFGNITSHNGMEAYNV